MNRNLPAVFLKVIAVASALALGGTFIARENAEGEKAKQREQAERAKALKEEKQNEETTLIVGSKSISMPVFSKRSVGSIIGSKDDAEAPTPKVLLPSSKSTSSAIFVEITREELDSVMQSYEGYIVTVDPPANDGETPEPEADTTKDEPPHIDDPEQEKSE